MVLKKAEIIERLKNGEFLCRVATWWFISENPATGRFTDIDRRSVQSILKMPELKALKVNVRSAMYKWQESENS